MNPLLVCLLLCEVISCITGFIYWKKIKNTYWVWFLVYLLYVTISGAIEFISNEYKILYLNIFFNHFFMHPIDFLFYYWLFYKNFDNTKFKLLPIASASIYLPTLIIDALTHPFNQQNFFLSFSYTVGNLLLLILIGCFFYIFVITNMILKYKHNMLFWVCIGLLIFYVGSAPYWSLINNLAAKYIDLLFILRNIMLLVSSGMYIFFTIGFIKGDIK